MFDFGWGGIGLPGRPDGGLRRSFPEEETIPQCTITADCEGTMVAHGSVLCCSVCKQEIPIEPERNRNATGQEEGG